MNIRKAMRIAAVLLAMLCLLCACSAQTASQEEATSQPELPELRIGVDTLNPFFFTDENGDSAGIDAEIAVEACNRAGYTPVFVPIDWDRKDTYLQNESVDCLWSAFSENGREDAYLWTEPYLQSNLRVIVSAQSPDKTLDSLKGRSALAVRAGSKIEEIFLKNEGGLSPIQVCSCGTFEMAETAFVKGYAKSLGGHEAVLEQVLCNYPGLYRFLDGNIMTVDLGVAFRKDGSSEKRDKLNDALVEMNADGTTAAIFAKYHSAPSVEEVHADAQK